MEYLLLFYSDDAQMAEIMANDPEPLMNRHVEFNKTVKARTRIVTSHALEPVAATVTVRPTGDGESVAVPGPASPNPVALNGFYLITCKDMDEAVDIAKRYPMPEDLGYIEVRPTVSRWRGTPLADSSAPREQVWERYADIESWPEWLAGVAAARGTFATGGTGELRMADGAVRPMRIGTVTDPISFTMEIEVAHDVWVWYGHYLTARPDGGTRIIHEPSVPHHALDTMGLHFTAAVNEQAAQSVATLAALAADRVQAGTRSRR
ncbi:YciI family protein [Nocardia arthritidis]|uniref:YCII-related domain-containing protein n=1 Tax=Nocardia arthritidis TaxID=228602 RepID=A0A6G9YEH9_9NOCA|nr:YciI family protein [Nocardia arthritidis]QIS11602.1 hypothetical protein F5544_18655 [Nocardia arthritidis]